jgi:hypothetical protein
MYIIINAILICGILYNIIRYKRKRSFPNHNRVYTIWESAIDNLFMSTFCIINGIVVFATLSVWLASML